MSVKSGSSTTKSEGGSGGQQENKQKVPLVLKVNPAYFSKLRKTHIDQLIPECGDREECGQKKEMKAFLAKLLVDGNL